MFIPAHLKPFVKSYVNVVPDGNCGFCTISISLGRSEDNWLWVQTEMLKELNAHPEIYTTSRLDNMLDMTLDDVRKCLNTTKKSVAHNPEFCLKMPGFIGIIANAFSRPVLFYSTQLKQEQVCYPHSSEINNNPPLLFLGHTNHFYSLD